MTNKEIILKLTERLEECREGRKVSQNDSLRESYGGEMLGLQYAIELIKSEETKND